MDRIYRQVGVGLLGAFFLLLAPQASEAYTVKNQQAMKVTPDAALYTITYEFGFLNADVWLPIRATMSDRYPESAGKVGYMLETEGEEYIPVQAEAVVLSDAAIVNDYYYVPRGERATFTLVAAVRTGAWFGETGVPTLKVRSLPYILAKNDEPKAMYSLGQAELKTYQAPASATMQIHN